MLSVAECITHHIGNTETCRLANNSWDFLMERIIARLDPDWLMDNSGGQSLFRNYHSNKRIQTMYVFCTYLDKLYSLRREIDAPQSQELLCAFDTIIRELMPDYEGHRISYKSTYIDCILEMLTACRILNCELARRDWG